MKHDLCKIEKKHETRRFPFLILALLIFIPILAISMPLWIFTLIAIAILAFILGVIIFIFG